uniref:Uncharacterized protein n=1 Tax=Anguilla anguilla TaxID=7936 RepID=A0A0E9RAN8_ANGAN
MADFAERRPVPTH